MRMRMQIVVIAVAPVLLSDSKCRQSVIYGLHSSDDDLSENAINSN